VFACVVWHGVAWRYAVLLRAALAPPDLGLQAAQRIVLGSEPLKLMQDINQNFPRLMQSLCKLKASA